MNKIRNKDVLDIVYAAGLYKANQAGVYGNQNTSPYEVGVMGGTSTDINEAEALRNEGKIGDEEYTANVVNAISAASSILINNAIQRGLDIVETFVNNHIPVLAPVVPVVRSVAVILANKVVEAGRKVFNWLKEKIFG
ncbi:MAG: hypothetical protein ACP5QK_04600 [Myxococcota bacterium]